MDKTSQVRVKNTIKAKEKRESSKTKEGEGRLEVQKTKLG